MSNNKIIHAIEIKLDVVLLEDASLGIFNTSGVSYLRWSEHPIVGTSDSWASGIISDGGLSAEEAGADLRRGGAPVAYTGYTIAAQSTYQNYLKLKSLGVNLVGRTIKRWEFEGSDTNAAVTSKKLLSTLIIQDSTWNVGEWKIQVMNATYTQNAFMGTIINNDPDSGNYKDATDDLNGKMVPLTYGAFKVIDGNPVCAKFIRTANQSTVILNDFIKSDIVPVGQEVFPIVEHVGGGSPYLSYSVRLGISGSDDTCANVIGMWLQVIIGGSADGTSLVGQYRKIVEASMSTNYQIDLMLDTYFDKDLAGNVTADAVGQAWVSIVKIPFEFAGDVFPLAGFFDTDGNVLQNSPILYAYKTDNSFLERHDYSVDADTQKLIITQSFAPIGFKKLPPYGYNVLSSLSNNVLSIDASLFDKDPSQLLSYDIFPLKNRKIYYAPNLTEWGFPTWLNIDNSDIYPFDNVFSDSIGVTVENYAISHSIPGPGGEANIYDKNDASYEKFLIQTMGSSGWNIKIAFEFDLPLDKVLFDYESYYLGVKISTISQNEGGYTGNPNGKVKILMRRFMGAAMEVLKNTNGAKLYDFNQYSQIDCLPNFYYIYRGTPDNNQAFGFDTALDSLSYPQQKLTYYKNYQIPSIANIEQLKSIYKIGLLYECGTTGSTGAMLNTIFLIEMTLMCKTSSSISNEIFTLCSGRIFNDTWGSRKTAANQMVTPADIIEHCKRLGNWGTPTVTPGLEYDAAALIKTGSVEGSFDMISMMPSTITTYPGFYKPTFQVDNDSEAWTAEIEKKLCATYGLCTYYDPDGTACIKSLLKESPSETINFEDLAGECSDVQPAQVQDVFCQPILNYQYNYGSSKFDKQLSITNIQADTYDPSYAMGFSGSDGEAVWNTCRALYLKYKQIEVPPSDWTDQKTVSTYGEALALIKMKLAWMNKYRITVPVFYDKGKNYHYAQHVNLALPHQTNGEVFECVIEKVIKDKNFNPAGKVEVSLVFIDDLDSISFFF